LRAIKLIPQHRNVTEEELIKGCIREDRHCQQEVFRLYAGKMLSLCMRYSRHYMEAEDNLQDAFIKVFDNIHKFQFKGSFEGWIRRIVINTALKKHNKKSYKNEIVGMENFPDSAADPDVYAHLGEETLLKLIAKLPTGYRVVFNLYAIDGYSHKEIADMLGVGESTSRSQLAKARSMLQKQVQKLQNIAV
jgi:RNA polymerase sigma factor (sigma-70 family)